MASVEVGLIEVFEVEVHGGGGQATCLELFGDFFESFKREIVLIFRVVEAAEFASLCALIFVCVVFVRALTHFVICWVVEHFYQRMGVGAV